MAVTKRTRYEVLRRDENRCRYCHSVDNPLTVDHVVPVALGGSDDPSNLVAACKDCNAGKTSASPDQPLVAQVEDDAVRWSRAMSRAAEILDAEDAAFNRYLGAFYSTWIRWSPSDSDNTLRCLYKAGLPENMLVDAADIALNVRGVDDRFRYFCGVAWKKVRRLQEIASEAIAEDAATDEEDENWDEWMRGYDAAAARYGTRDMFAIMLESVVDGVASDPWGKPLWWGDLHPREFGGEPCHASER